LVIVIFMRKRKSKPHLSNLETEAWREKVEYGSGVKRTMDAKPRRMKRKSSWR